MDDKAEKKLEKGMKEMKGKKGKIICDCCKQKVAKNEPCSFVPGIGCYFHTYCWEVVLEG